MSVVEAQCEKSQVILLRLNVSLQTVHNVSPSKCYGTLQNTIPLKFVPSTLNNIHTISRIVYGFYGFLQLRQALSVEIQRLKQNLFNLKTNFTQTKE